MTNSDERAARLAAQLEASDHQILVSTHLLEHVYDFERVLWLERGKVRGDVGYH